MPWDGGEFLNRSWPVLWCIGLWMLACAPWPAGILPSPPFREPRWLVLSAAALLALSWMVLPPIRRASIAAPLLADWAQPGYPLSIPAKEKSLARDLRLVVGDGFFYHPDSSLSVPLAALSGSRIVFMDPGLWIRLEARMREERVAGIRARQQTLQAEYAAACSRGATALRPGSPGGSAGLVVLPPIQPRTWALCTNTA
jgi:hypothetical protein